MRGACLSVSSVTGGASGSTTATLTVAFNSDFHLPSTLGVRVLAAAHSGSTDLTTGKTLPLTPTPDIQVEPATLSVNEGASATYTVTLSRRPHASVTVTVASDNADVTADTSTASGTQTTLTFTTNNWNTAQTVTATAAGDSGSGDETATLSHTASGATSYEAAFPGAAAGMGCPDGSDADDMPDACTGYKLTRDLDFEGRRLGGASAKAPCLSVWRTWGLGYLGVAHPQHDRDDVQE